MTATQQMNQARMVRERAADARRYRLIRELREEMATLTEFAGHLEGHVNRHATQDEDRRNARAKIATARRRIRDIDTQLVTLDETHTSIIALAPSPVLPRTEHRYLRNPSSFGYQPPASELGRYRHHAYGCAVDGGPGLPAGRCGKCAGPDSVETAFLAGLIRGDGMVA